MMDDFKAKFKSLFERIKKIKNIKIYAIIFLSIVVVMTYLLLLPSQKEKEEHIEVDNICTEFSNSGEYIVYLENKLENVITAIKGVGEAEVVVTLEKGFEYIYQTKEETRSTSNGTSITTSEVVMVDGKPVVKEEIYPIVKGIVIVAEGSNNVNVRMDILNLVQTMIDIEHSQIKIMEGK